MSQYGIIKTYYRFQDDKIQVVDLNDLPFDQPIRVYQATLEYKPDVTLNRREKGFYASVTETELTRLSDPRITKKMTGSDFYLRYSLLHPCKRFSRKKGESLIEQAHESFKAMINAHIGES